MSNFKGLKLQTKGGEVGFISDSFGTEGKFRVEFPDGAELEEGARMTCVFWKVKGGADMEQGFLDVPERAERRDIVIEVKPAEKREEKAKPEKKPAKEEVDAKTGRVAKVKDDGTLIVEGMFTPAVDVDKFKGRKVVVGDGREGEIIGRFGKAGKCKVKAEGLEGEEVKLIQDK